MEYLRKFKDSIESLTDDQVASIEKHLYYGKGLVIGIGSVGQGASVPDLLHRSMGTLSSLKTAIKAVSEKLYNDDDKFIVKLKDNDKVVVLQKDECVKFHTDHNMVEFTHREIHDALLGIYQIRNYIEFEKANEASKLRKMSKLEAEVELLQFKVDEKDPMEALKMKRVELAKLK